MSEFQGEFMLVDVMELVPNPNNAKIHTKKQIDVLSRSMKEVGFNDPIHITEEKVVLAGHGRLQAAKKLGLVKVPCLAFSHLTDTQKKAYTLSHNQIGNMTGYDETLLSIEIESLKDEDFNLDLLGFDTKLIDKLLDLDNPEDDRDDLGDASPDLPGIVQLSSTMSVEEDEWLKPYDIVRLRQDRIAECPDEFTVWIGKHRTTDPGGPLFYLYGSDSTVGMEAARTTVAFYVDDIRFERVWNNLPEWTTKFLTGGVKSLIMPDFSINWTMAKAAMIWNTYRAFYVGRYWQEAGINVIPSLNFTRDPADLEYMMAGIPEGCPALSWQIQTFTGGSEGEYADTCRTMMGIALERIKPVKLLTYGGEPGLRLGKEICERHDVQHVGVLNRAAHMRGDVAKHEKVRAF